jgi:hypothetical protein
LLNFMATTQSHEQRGRQGAPLEPVPLDLSRGGNSYLERGGREEGHGGTRQSLPRVLFPVCRGAA